MRKIGMLALFALILCFLFTGPVEADEGAQWLKSAQEALTQGLSEINAAKGDSDILILSNAGYGQIGAQTTEAFPDLARTVTGCSQGARSLLTIHGSVNDPLWFSLYHKGSGKLVFRKWTNGAFTRQSLDAAPEKILTPEGWKAAAAGLIGPQMFSVVSVSVTWAVNPPWPLLQAALFHDHFCPGVNAGYIAAARVREKLPLGPGDKYVFASAPGKCWADALQVMFNATAGKSGSYTVAISPKKLDSYTVQGVQPITVAMRVNGKKDSCQGVALGFDWQKAYADTGVKVEEMAPKGGPANPMFWVARVKMARELARTPMETLQGYIMEMREFSGKAELANMVGGGDPYAKVWNQ